MINERVYNISFGGYCPAHSLILWNDALALHPKIIIEAFYAGNDLLECYKLVYKKDQLPDFKDTSSATQMKLNSAEKADPLEDKVVWLQGMIFGKLNNSGPGKATDVSTNKSTISENKVSWPRKFLSQHSMIYALLRATYWTLTSFSSEESALDTGIVIEDIPARVKLYPDYLELFDNGHYKTAFTPEYRRAVVNLEDARITEGHLVALKSIQIMSELAESRHIRFLVVLIPTKESVFQDLVKTPTAHYSSLIKAERIMWDRTKQFLRQKGIEYVDAQPALGQQLAAGKQPYYNSTDGHPNAFGHEAIAEAVKHELEYAGKE